MHRLTKPKRVQVQIRVYMDPCVGWVFSMHGLCCGSCASKCSKRMRRHTCRPTHNCTNALCHQDTASTERKARTAAAQTEQGVVSQSPQIVRPCLRVLVPLACGHSHLKLWMFGKGSWVIPRTRYKQTIIPSDVSSCKGVAIMFGRMKEGLGSMRRSKPGGRCDSE